MNTNVINKVTNRFLEYVFYSREQRMELAARRRYQTHEINMLGYLEIVRELNVPK